MNNIEYSKHLKVLRDKYVGGEIDEQDFNKRNFDIHLEYQKSRFFSGEIDENTYDTLKIKLEEEYEYRSNLNNNRTKIADNKDLFDKRYKIIKKLGEGGMATVYLAEHISLAKKVAVKKMLPSLITDQSYIDRFSREARSQARLSHPNIVQVIEFHRDSLSLIIEYVEGDTLEDIIFRQKPLKEKVALSIIKKVLDGLNYAHQQGIIHRDIKPCNIMIDVQNNVKITDFGIALIIGEERNTNVGHGIGTAEYMSPEQVRGDRNIDCRTDVYSSGIVLYEMLTGSTPFSVGADQSSEFIIYDAHINMVPKPPMDINNNVSRTLSDIIMKALEKYPDDRYTDCGEFYRAIDEYDNKISAVEFSIDPVNRYSVISELGKGGMATVYLATDNKLHKKVAIKKMLPKFANDKQYIDRFAKEACSQAKLDHPNIVRVFEYDKSTNSLIMEYIEGTTLKKLLNEMQLSESESLNIIKQILDSLNYAHQKGVIHRDIKPSNIMIDKHNNVKISDFGIALIMGQNRMTRTGIGIGTTDYMSPEQILGYKDIDHRTDVYSCGILLYEMITGFTPFREDADDTISDYHIKEAHVKVRPKAPAEINKSISRSLSDLILKALEKSPNDRYLGCGDFLNYIMQYEASLEHQNTRSDLKNDTRKTRSVLLIGITFVFVLILFGLLLFITVIDRQNNEDNLNNEDYAMADMESHDTERRVRELEIQLAELQEQRRLEEHQSEEIIDREHEEEREPEIQLAELQEQRRPEEHQAEEIIDREHEEEREPEIQLVELQEQRRPEEHQADEIIDREHEEEREPEIQLAELQEQRRPEEHQAEEIIDRDTRENVTRPDVRGSQVSVGEQAPLSLTSKLSPSGHINKKGVSFGYPRGFTILEDDIFITETTGTRFDYIHKANLHNISNMSEFNRERLVRPTDIAVNRMMHGGSMVNVLIVTDTYNQPPLIKMFDPLGYKIRESQGWGKPAFIASSLTEQIFYVSDYETGFIYKYDTMLRETGRSSEKLQKPMGITLHKNMLYVVENLTRKIHVFDKNLIRIRSFDIPHSASPIGVCIFEDYILVSDYKNKYILTFTLDGEFLGILRLRGIESPYYLMKYGNKLYVSDKENGSIMLFGE